MERIRKGEILKGFEGGKTIRIEGTARLRRQLDRLDGAMRRELLQRMVTQGGELVARVAGMKAPIDEGVLSESVIVEMIESSAYHATAGIGPHKDAFYGKFQEFGTQKHGAQPFLRPAYDEQKRPAVRVMADVARARIRRAVK